MRSVSCKSRMLKLYDVLFCVYGLLHLTRTCFCDHYNDIHAMCAMLRANQAIIRCFEVCPLRSPPQGLTAGNWVDLTPAPSRDSITDLISFGEGLGFEVGIICSWERFHSIVFCV